MSRLIQVQLPTGQTIWANVADGPADVSASQTLRRLPLEDLQETIEGVTQTIAEAAERVRPDEVSLEFGLELSLKTGKLTSVLAEAAGKASLRLTLTWNPGPRRRGDGPSGDQD